jgi:hypothetical protein
MKFELNRLPRESSLKEIKAEVIRVANLINDTIISKKKFDEISKISTSNLVRKFGSWRNTLNECGLEHRYCGQTITTKMKNQGETRKLTNLELIQELQRIANFIGKKELSQQEFNNNSKLNSATVSRRFKSWSEGLKAANLKPVAKRYTQLDYFENLLNVWTYYGRQPKYNEMNNHPSVISSSGYERKWGKWSSALQAFIDYANSDKATDEQISQEQSFIILKKTTPKSPEENRNIPLGLRYKILNRDRFRCVKCGKSPASDLKCKLHIDHIIPFSMGGLTTFENLQTTCSDCNLGKGNRYDV